ncbi:SDR family NAD(P)-dependent oxidoreductase [Citromicrobium bathyomarinum]|uniref:SDR family NAD(P)-dependent oxidoreductase n=1 Tax=Citromicrobium bathyomarinum TaxID=72174 RepID=UPI001E5CA63C|nr:glucose 1-dehydrogenase [Citromicrobium bathyomarinum]MCD1623385.1 glucose 1-dehydrogenase [Citromicrobium bathyomarinum]
MTKRLDGKIALITGGASVPGLGSATAQRLAEEGAKVCVTDIDLDGAEAVAKGIRDAGGTAMALKQDVADEADWDSVLDRIAQEWGSLDILVNNAGIAVLRPIENLTSADWNKQLTVNLDSVFFGTRRAVEIMRKAGKGGSIVNLSSVAGLVGVPACSAYAAAKAGVRMFGKTIAIECARDNIRVNSIHPGMIDTNMQNVAKADNAEHFDAVVDSIPMGRMGDPVDIANAVLFLSCDEGRYVTGTELVVDGGMTAQ